MSLSRAHGRTKTPRNTGPAKGCSRGDRPPVGRQAHWLAGPSRGRRYIWRDSVTRRVTNRRGWLQIPIHIGIGCIAKGLSGSDESVEVASQLRMVLLDLLFNGPRNGVLHRGADVRGRVLELAGSASQALGRLDLL